MPSLEYIDVVVMEDPPMDTQTTTTSQSTPNHDGDGGGDDDDDDKEVLAVPTQTATTTSTPTTTNTAALARASGVTISTSTAITPISKISSSSDSSKSVTRTTTTTTKTKNGTKNNNNKSLQQEQQQKRAVITPNNNNNGNSNSDSSNKKSNNKDATNKTVVAIQRKRQSTLASFFSSSSSNSSGSNSGSHKIGEKPTTPATTTTIVAVAGSENKNQRTSATTTTSTTNDVLKQPLPSKKQSRSISTTTTTKKRTKKKNTNLPKTVAQDGINNKSPAEKTATKDTDDDTATTNRERARKQLLRNIVIGKISTPPPPSSLSIQSTTEMVVPEEHNQVEETNDDIGCTTISASPTTTIPNQGAAIGVVVVDAERDTTVDVISAAAAAAAAAAPIIVAATPTSIPTTATVLAPVVGDEQVLQVPVVGGSNSNNSKNKKRSRATTTTSTKPSKSKKTKNDPRPDDAIASASASASATGTTDKDDTEMVTSTIESDNKNVSSNSRTEKSIDGLVVLDVDTTSAPITILSNNSKKKKPIESKKSTSSPQKMIEIEVIEGEDNTTCTATSTGKDTTAIKYTNVVQNAEEFEKAGTLRQAYTKRLVDQLLRCCRSDETKHGLPEEDALFESIQATIPSTLPSTINTPFSTAVGTSGPESNHNSNTFPDFAITTLVHLIEGQSLPFNDLVISVTDKLNQLYTESNNSTKSDDSNNVNGNDVTDAIHTTDIKAASYPFTNDVVGAKIQLLAARNHVVKGNTSILKTLNIIATSDQDTTYKNCKNILSFFDDDRMYRWEVVTPSIDSYAVFFPNLQCRTNVKKARAARKKVSVYCSSLVRMLSSLHDIQQRLYQPSNAEKSKETKVVGKEPMNDVDDKQREKLWSRFHLEEEKILKMDREYEAYRIAEVARNEKIEMDRKIKEEQQKKKIEVAAAKQKEKELKQQQLQQAKAEALLQQQQQKATKKETGIANNSLEKQQQPIVAKDVLKQKKCMMSFLAKSSALVESFPITVNGAVPEVPSIDTQEGNVPFLGVQNELSFDGIHSPASQQRPFTHIIAQSSSNGACHTEKKFDVDAFRLSLASSSDDTKCDIRNAFQNLTDSAKRSRQPRQKIRVPVYVTVDPSNEFEHDNPFASQQPYAEQIYITIRNRYKFLSFYEDVRPPYYGTWNKTSSIVTGKNPFGIDPTHLDYDGDSEGEWEEEDGEIGEEIGDDAIEDEEEKEFEEEDEDDDDDGWLAADDEVDDEDDDDDNDDPNNEKSDKPKHATGAGSSSKREPCSVCIISPNEGLPLSRDTISSSMGKGKVEGINQNDAVKFTEKFFAVQLMDNRFCMDAFPPPLVEEIDANEAADKNSVMSPENMKIFATFVHNCTFGSKDKVVDELLQAHPTVSSTRAQAYRLLDSIAEKKKHPCDGSFFWEVKKEILDDLGLSDMSSIQVEDVKQEAMRTIVRFVHYSSLPSKERVVDELRLKYENVTASRAEAMRIVQSIATKEKHPNGGHYWNVKQDLRDELGIDSYLNGPPGIPVIQKQDPNNQPTKKLEYDPSALSKKKRKVAPTPLLPNAVDVTACVDSRSSKLEGAHANVLISRKKQKVIVDNKEHRNGGSAKLLASFVVKKTKEEKEVKENLSNVGDPLHDLEK